MTSSPLTPSYRALLTAELFKNVKSEDESSAEAPKILYLAITSDGGLCGGIHSGISRFIKKQVAQNPGSLAIVGDKPKAQLSRAMPKDIRVTFNAVGKDVPTFAEASAIADEVVKNGGEWDEVGPAF
jgi:F-type H+-transporting ATPase subunit gamma